MNAKKGISLIVLVITIIVVIILAAAVLLSINNNNPIDNSNKAVKNNDKSETQSAVTLLLGSVMADVKESVTIDGADAAIDLSDTPAIVTKDGTKQVYQKADGTFTLDATEMVEEVSKPTTAVTLSSDFLDIPQTTLDKFKIDAKGKVSE